MARSIFGFVTGGLLLAGVACSTAQPPARTPAPQSASAAQGDAAAVARARADSARLPYTAADIRFMTAMIGHHAQALEMARLAPTHGASASVQTLAARIVNGQHDEIRTMQQWLRDRGQPVPDPDSAHVMHATPAHAGHGAQGTHEPYRMPGMLTPEQMAQLAAARGTDFDVLFLRYMIQHHRGAVAMVKDLFATYGAGQDETVFRFATDVNVDQTTEIERMELMLADLLFGPEGS